MNKMLHNAVILLLLATLAPRFSAACAQGTAFTYQGWLNSGGNPVNGGYDLTFTLYPTNLTGAALAGPVTNSATVVTNGRFTTLVDFGPDVFTGTNDWLEIAVRTNATGGFTSLAPRQPVTPAPYAVYAVNAGNAATATTAGTAGSVAAAGITGAISVAATNIVGTLPATQLPAGVLTNGASGVNLTGTFSGNGGGLTSLNAANLTGSVPASSLTSVAATNIVGTLPAALLPASVITNGASGVNLTGTFGGDGGGLTNVPGTLAQTVAAGTNFTAQANTAYNLTSSAQVSVTLPATANVGDVIQVTGTGAGGWQVTGDLVFSLASWTEQTNAPTAADWWAVASSADGTHLVAVDNGGGVYTSADCGVTWTEQTNAPTSAGWTGVASSADGTHLVAVASGGIFDIGGGIYTSANSGVTWMQQTNAPTAAYWNGVASSADGTHLVAVAYEGGVYTSANSGVTWTEQTNAPTSAYWYGVASSADGTQLVAVDYYSGGIYTSTNCGVTWTEQPGSPTSVDAIASSADGTHLVAVTYGGGIYTSINSGVTWTEQPGAPTSADWWAVASSADGTHLLAVDNGGGIYTSANSGVAWTEQTNAPTPANWTGVASSADGTHLVALNYGGGIYTSLDAVTGAAGTAEQFQYLGNGLWQPLPPTAGYLANNGSTVLSPGNGSGLTSLNAANLTGSVPASLLTSVPATSIVGTLPAALLPASVITNGASGVNLTGTFGGDGGGLTNVPATNIVGTLPATHLPAGVITNGASGVNLTGAFGGNGVGLTNVPAGSLTGLIFQSNLGTTNACTPTIGDGTHNFTTSVQSGYYAEVGNLVCVQIWLEWTSKGSAVSTNAVQISLPVPVAAPGATFTLGCMNGFTFNNQLVATTSSGLSYFILDDLSKTGGAATNLTVSSCGASGELQISGVYRWQ